MARKQKAIWMVFLQSVGVALGIYLLAQVLISLLVVKGSISEQAMLPSIAVSCGIASLIGSLLSIKQSGWGGLQSALLSTACFCVILIAVGALFWDGISWTGQGGILLISALAGGLAGVLFGGKRGRKAKRKVKRR